MGMFIDFAFAETIEVMQKMFIALRNQGVICTSFKYGLFEQFA